MRYQYFATIEQANAAVTSWRTKGFEAYLVSNRVRDTANYVYEVRYWSKHTS